MIHLIKHYTHANYYLNYVKINTLNSIKNLLKQSTYENATTIDALLE